MIVDQIVRLIRLGTRLLNFRNYAPQGHDDLANVVAGIAHCAVNRHSLTVTERRLCTQVTKVGETYRRTCDGQTLRFGVLQEPERNEHRRGRGT